MNDYRDAFVSYSHQDRNVMEKIVEALKFANIRVWTDFELRASENWKYQIRDKLKNVVALIYLASPNSSKSKWVQAEIEDASNRNIPIFTLLIDGTSDDIVFGENPNQHIDCRGENLISGISQLLIDYYARFRRQLLYRPLSKIVNRFPNSQTRAAVYCKDRDDNLLTLHTVYGIFSRPFLGINYEIGQGIVGQVWQKPDTSYLADWGLLSKKDMEDELHMNDDQINAMKNLRMVMGIPIISGSYNGEFTGDVIGVLIVDSPYSLDELRLGYEKHREITKAVFDIGLERATELAILLDIENGKYEVSVA